MMIRALQGIIKVDKMKRNRLARRRDAHHLWEAEKEDGKVRVKRTKDKDEDKVMSPRADEKTARIRRRASLNRRVVEESALACLGIWGATLVDDDVFTRPIPKAIVARFNSVRDDDTAPRVYSWSELEKAAKSERIASVRKAVTDGMRTRLISKELNVPFLVAAEIIDKLDGLDTKRVKAAIAAVRSNTKTAQKKYGSVAKDIHLAFAKYGGKKLAVDDKAKKYFESYFGPYGQELVAEIQRRVRADLAYKWLRKNAVDDVAAAYWSNYFSEGGYGAAMVSIVPKKLSPAK